MLAILSKPLRSLGQRLDAFVSTPTSPRPLAILRIGLAVVLIAQTVSLWDSMTELFGTRGVIQAPVVESVSSPYVLRARWLVEFAARQGVGEEVCLRGLFQIYLGSLAALLLGWRTRVAAVIAWLVSLSLKTSSSLSAYGAYEFANIALFYCVWMPVGHALSLDRRSGRVSDAPSPGACLSLRVLQLHLCIVYVASGIEKASGEQWRNGEAIWRALMRCDLGQFDFSWLADCPHLAQFICWGTLAVEIGYAFLIWSRWTRCPTALAAIGMHAGIAVTMGLWSFSALMIVLNTAAFLMSGRGREKGDVKSVKKGPAPA
jgi:hypothetical protein